MSAVNCNGCTACCWRDVVILEAGEAQRYAHHEEWHNGRKLLVLDRREDGACVYLGEGGCSIYGRAPGICQRMDCRRLVADTTPAHREKRVRQHPHMLHVYMAGAERLHTLKD